MVHYKLVYFAARGRAEPIRLMFAYAGVAFEDVALPGAKLFEERAAGRLTPPFGSFPYLEVDGKCLGQSGAIMRYLAKKFDLYPAGDFEAAVAESILDQVADVSSAAYSDLVGGTDETRAAFYSTKLPKLMGGIATYLGDKPFLFGEHLTFADIALHGLVDAYGVRGVDLTVGFPTIAALSKRVSEHPKLREYVEKRNRAEAEAAAAEAAKKAAGSA